jgi:hypothetical protein
MWGCNASNNGVFGMRPVGTHATNSPDTVVSEDGYNGITRIWNPSSNTIAGYSSGAATLFRNLPATTGILTIIFRPWPLGTTSNTTLYVGFSSNFNATASIQQYAWQFSTNIATTNEWVFRQDGATVHSSGYTTAGANQWHKMTLTRTSSTGYTTTLQNIEAPSAIYSYSGTAANISQQLFMGGCVSCVSGAASKYLDIDYIACTFNSVH